MRVVVELLGLDGDRCHRLWRIVAASNEPGELGSGITPEIAGGRINPVGRNLLPGNAALVLDRKL
jgi:hypothetical protein